MTTEHDAFKEAEQSVQARIDRILQVRGTSTPRELHRELGRLLWDDVGMSRNDAGLQRALTEIPKLREEFWQNVSVPGEPNNLNKNLEYAGRVADYLEFAELLALDALERTESCGGHFRDESQTRRRRGATERHGVLTCVGVGVHGRRPASQRCTRSRSCSSSSNRRSGATSRPVMRIHLRVWRQSGPNAPGKLEIYTAEDVSPDMSFLEMLDVVNEQIIKNGAEPIAFDSDCREGICGACGFVINGRPHGPDPGTTVCQLHMRRFKDGDTITLEPWRAAAFPVVKDLVVDRSAFDRIIQSGGYTSVNTGGAPDANAIPVSRLAAEAAMDAAQCIGCGACVAACKNASAALFTSAKVAHLGQLPQGRVEARSRVINMVERMDAEGFGSCSNEGECEAVCPKGISLINIGILNRDTGKPC